MKIRAAVLNEMGRRAPLRRDRSRSRSRRSSSTRPDRARSWSRSPPRACATRTCRSSRATGRGRCRWRSATRRPASSRNSAPASTTSSAATTSSWCSCRAAAIACPARRDARRCASPAPPPTRRGTLLSGGEAPPPQRPGRSTIISASRLSPNTPPCRAARWSRSIRELPFDEAALFGCAVLTGVGAVINTAKVSGRIERRRDRPRRRRSQLPARRRRGGRAPGRRRRPLRREARPRPPARRDRHVQRRVPPMPSSEVREATGGGVEYAFEMAGSVRAMDLAYKITRRGGTTVTAGLPPPTHTCPSRRSTSSPRSAR